MKNAGSIRLLGAIEWLWLCEQDDCATSTRVPTGVNASRLKNH